MEQPQMDQKQIDKMINEYEQQKDDGKDLIITYSDYSRARSGFGRQMTAILPHLRREFNVIEFAIGASPQIALEEQMKHQHIIIPTCDEQGRSVNDEYYGQSLLQRLIADCMQQKRVIKACFINHDMMCFGAITKTLKQANIPIILWALIDNEYISYNTIGILSLPEVIIYQTNFGRESVMDLAPFLDGPVIYPAIHTEWLVPINKEKHFHDNEFVKKTEGRKVVFFNGKNQSRKNIACLLDAIKIVLKDRGRDDIAFIVHAPGTKQEHLGVDYSRKADEALDFMEYTWNINYGKENLAVNEERLPDEEINAFYELADVVILPSCSEGFGMPFLEAFYKKIPCIGTNYSASGEVLGENRGLLVDPDRIVFQNERRVKWAYLDEEMLANAIEHVIDNLEKEEIQTMVQNGREFIEKYNSARQAKKLIEVISDVIENHKAWVNAFPVQVLL